MLRHTGTEYIDWGQRSSKVYNLTDNYTVAVWVRPWDVTSGYHVPVYTSYNDTNGWIFLTTFLTGSWTSYAWGANSYGNSGINTYVSSSVLDLGKWSLCVMVHSYSAAVNGETGVVMFTNGVHSPRSYSPLVQVNLTGGNLKVGSYTPASSTNYAPACDLGPVMVWNTVLTNQDIALLYRDTWGMVSVPRRPRVYAGTSPTPTPSALQTAGFYRRWRRRRSFVQ